MQPLIEPQINQVIQILKTAPDCQSIWLLGSAARNEASFLLHTDSSLEVFSDYEFMVVMPRRPTPEVRQRLDAQIEALEYSFHNPNPLFHIDLILRERRRLTKMPSIIFTFEMKQNAQLLYGEDTRALLPDITLQNLNLHEANEIIYKRFWAILFYLPQRFLVGEMTPIERRVVGYLLCRNALDLTTTLLPHERILLPTYRQRVERLSAVYSQLNLRRYFDEHFPSFLADCLALRQSLDFQNDDLLARYVRVIHYLEQALHCVLGSSEPLAQAVPYRSRQIFNEWGVSRGEAYNFARLTAAMTRRYGARRGAKWLFAPKRGYLTLGLWAMHKAVLAWRRCAPAEARQWLDESREALHVIAVEDVPCYSEDFATDWLALRRGWANFWREYNLMLGAHYKRRFDTILEWPYDKYAHSLCG